MIIQSEIEGHLLNLKGIFTEICSVKVLLCCQQCYLSASYELCNFSQICFAGLVLASIKSI
jgi:hypothetical protein